MKALLSKILTLLVLIRYPRVPSQFRFFIRYFYLGKLMQLKFFMRDYWIKRPYKVVQYKGEFGTELKFVLPHAYWHFKNGTLLKTVSCPRMREFYFFSPNHEERFEAREWNDFNFDLEIPNSEDHNLKFDFTKWERVPLKKFYRNSIFTFEKPIVIISNKYNIEWNEDPVNYFSIETLNSLFLKLHKKYQIIYNRPHVQNIINDNSEILDLDDYQWIKGNFPKVIVLSEFYEKYKNSVNNFNHFQLLVYSNCEKFISIHGGSAVLSSYFEGVNLILSKKGHEHFFHEFEKFYPKLSGAKILHSIDESSLLKNIELHF